jgi:hypothetical protein
MKQVLAGLGRAFAGVGGRASIVAVNIDGIEGLHDLATSDPARDDVGGLYSVRVIRRWMRTIGRSRPRWLRDELVSVENALDGAQAGRYPITLAVFALDGACSNASKAQARWRAPNQLLPQADHTSLDDLGRLVGMRMGCSRTRLETCPGMLCSMCNPFVHPTWISLELSGNIFDRLARTIHVNCYPTLLSIGLI